jgi:hypothetical protein
MDRDYPASSCVYRRALITRILRAIAARASRKTSILALSILPNFSTGIETLRFESLIELAIVRQ